MGDLEIFFEELKKQHVKERQDFVWDWAGMRNLPSATQSEFVHFIAFNFAKNILHGPLPDNLHSRMILAGGEWPKKYVEFLEK